MMFINNLNVCDTQIVLCLIVKAKWKIGALPQKVNINSQCFQ